MTAAIYGKRFSEEFSSIFQFFVEELKQNGFKLCIFDDFVSFILENKIELPSEYAIFTSHEDIPQETEIFFSVGGDGTFLEGVSFVRNSGIPMVGINSGRLGFLANISAENIKSALLDIKNGKYKIEYRTLLEVKSGKKAFSDWNFALNEVTVQKRDSASMIITHLFADNELINSYWSDGVIISTPTGSTAYSLSVGGPIVAPESSNFVITPIAPHTLTVRPMILPDTVKLRLQIESRQQNYLASVDSHYEVLDNSIGLLIKKAGFKIKMLKFENTSYFETLRTKLMWGLNKRS